jgi:hypothetical protein
MRRFAQVSGTSESVWDIGKRLESDWGSSACRVQLGLNKPTFPECSPHGRGGIPERSPCPRRPAPRQARAGCWRSATARWGSGAGCVRCSPTPASNAAGFTRYRMFLPCCRSRRTPARRRRWRRSRTPRTNATPTTLSRHSRPPTARSFPRPSPRSPTTSSSCWRSTTTRPNIGCI